MHNISAEALIILLLIVVNGVFALAEVAVLASRKARLQHLAKEGGHSKRRILHSEDATGKELENVLIKNCQKKSSIKFWEFHQAIDLIKGLSIDQAIERISDNLPLATESKIILSPKWWPRLPLLPMRIQILQAEMQ